MSRKDQTIAYYNDFVTCYEQGMTMVEIAKRNNISERSIYILRTFKEEEYCRIKKS